MWPRSDPNRKPVSKQKKEEPEEQVAPGRFSAAWSVLRGQRLVPLQVQAEWLTYQQIFDDVLKRLGAQLARQAKAEKGRLDQFLLEHPESFEPPSLRLSSQDDLRSRKDAIRERFAQRRAGNAVSAPQQPAEVHK